MNRSRERLVVPDACAHVAGASGEVAAHWAGGHRDDRVLVTLQHELRVARPRVPELHAAILGSGEHPVSVGGESDGENEVLREMSVQIHEVRISS